MNKTISITMQGIAFLVEEKAYALLQEYLTAIRKQFAEGEEAQEVVDEVESRIAELFLEEILQGREVVIEEDITRLKEIMGEVKDFADEEGDPIIEPKAAKKFYRDGENKVIAGVSSGLAAYFGVDPTIVRVVLGVCLISGVLSGFVVIMYLLLWIVSPVAETLSDKMEMRGKQITLKTIEEQVKKTVSKGSEFVQEKKMTDSQKGAISGFFQKLFSLIGVVFSAVVVFAKKLWKVVGKFVGVIFLLIGVLGFSLVTFFSGLLLFNPTSPLVDIPFNVINATSDYYTLIISVALVIALPLFFLAFLGFRILKKNFAFPLTLLVILLFAWGGALATSIIFTVKVIPEIQSAIEQQDFTATSFVEDYEKIDKRIELDNFSSLKVESDYLVEVLPAESFSIELAGAKKDIEETLVSVQGDKLTITRDRHFVFCLFCVSNPVQVTLYIPEALEQVRLSGASELIMNDIIQDQFILQLSGSSQANVDLDVQELLVTVSGSSDINLSGKASKVSLQGSGYTSFEALFLEVAQATLDLSGVAKASVFVTDTLVVEASGSSYIMYKGEAEVESSLTGNAKVKGLFLDSPLMEDSAIESDSQESTQK